MHTKKKRFTAVLMACLMVLSFNTFGAVSVALAQGSPSINEEAGSDSIIVPEENPEDSSNVGEGQPDSEGENTGENPEDSSNVGEDQPDSEGENAGENPEGSLNTDEGQPGSEGENAGENPEDSSNVGEGQPGSEGENAGENPEDSSNVGEGQPGSEKNIPTTDSLRQPAAQTVEVGEGDKHFLFHITSSKTGPQNITDSGVGLGVDGPGAGSTYSGHAWNEEGYELITVVDEKSAADEGITLDGLNNPNVLKFYLHDTKDYDGSKTDRQRIELKAYNKSSEDVLGVEGDIITYNWKFYLPENLVETPPPGFFHIFQIKAIDGSEAGSPIFTFTVTEKELLFRNVRLGGDMSTIDVIDRIPIQSALGRWMEADVTIQYRDNGYVNMSLTDAASGENLMSGYGPYDCWRRPEYKLSDGSLAEGSEDAPITQRTRPKWGLYRSIGRADSGTVVSDASMYFGDLNIIKRNKDTYIFADGYDPKDAGEIPNRKPDTFTYTDSLEDSSIKAGYDKGSDYKNIFNSDSSLKWDITKNYINNKDTQLWMAIDLGSEKAVNQASLTFDGSGPSSRLKKVIMAYTNNDSAFGELVEGNNGTKRPFETDNGSSWTPFVLDESPAKSKNYTLEEAVAARYILLLMDPYSKEDGKSEGSIKIVSWSFGYEAVAAEPLQLIITSPQSGDNVGSGPFEISGEISNILNFKQLSKVEVLNQEKEVVASAAAVQSENDPTKAVYTVRVPAPTAAGEYKYTLSVSEPSKVEGSLRIDRAAVTISAQGIIEDVDNDYTEPETEEDDNDSSSDSDSDDLSYMVLEDETDSYVLDYTDAFQIRIRTNVVKTASQRKADTMTPEKLLDKASSIAPELSNMVDLRSAVTLSSFDVAAVGKQPSSGEPLKVQFRLSGLQKNQYALVLHRMKNGEWELIGISELGARSVWATFTSLSPVTILAVNAKTIAQTEQSEAVAPPAAVFDKNPSTGAC